MGHVQCSLWDNPQAPQFCCIAPVILSPRLLMAWLLSLIANEKMKSLLCKLVKCGYCIVCEKQTNNKRTHNSRLPGILSDP